MREIVWLEGNDPQGMLRHLHESGAAPRKLRLFACACCRYAWAGLADRRSRAAVETAERHADAAASAGELAAARAEAWEAAWGSRATAAMAAAWAAEADAWKAAWKAARHTAPD